MAKLFQILIGLFLVFPSLSYAETNTSNVKVAFTRDGYLWIKNNEIEERITNKKATYNYPPSWSFDGKMLLYQKEVTGNIVETKRTSNELWVYNVENKTHRKIFYDGYSPEWCPTENIVAFMDDGVLNISDLKQFYNIALGVYGYEWQPDGKGFIASSRASLRPDGWTNPILYTISLEEGYQQRSDLTMNVKELFVIPKEVGKDGVTVYSINTDSYSYSPNEQWISFIISPTASWSMDSDMLCVISTDGKKFEVIDEVILDFTPKWAYTQDLLGYIAGGGRIVLGFKNKDLKVTDLPAFHHVNLTPKNYAEMGFSWVNDTSLIVSRVHESDWSNRPEQRPKPSLYHVTLDGQEQLRITKPPQDVGDFNPQFLPVINKITWIRKSDIVADTADLWIADVNGHNASIWIHDVGLYDFYPMQ